MTESLIGFFPDGDITENSSIENGAGSAEIDGGANPSKPFANNIFEKLIENEPDFQTATPPSATTTKRFVEQPTGNNQSTGNKQSTGTGSHLDPLNYLKRDWRSYSSMKLLNKPKSC